MGKMSSLDDGIRHRSAGGDVDGKETENPAPKPINRFDSNKYNSRKTIAKGMLDVALLTNNISNLKQLLKHRGTPNEHPIFPWMTGGLLTSISLQVVIAFVLLMVGNKDVNKEEEQDSAMQWNDILTGLVLVQTVLNVSITQFMDL